MDKRSGIQSLRGATSVKTVRMSRSDKFARLVDVLQEMVESEFTGHIKINFSQGGIGRIEKFEEILRGAAE